MNTLLANLLQTLNELAEHGRVFFDALSLHAPGAGSAVAVLALCATAAVVVLDASRRTLAVPTRSYLRRDVAQLAAERDGKGVWSTRCGRSARPCKVSSRGSRRISCILPELRNGA